MRRTLAAAVLVTQLSDYMISQSNAAMAIESGRRSAKALHMQIMDETSAFFPADLTAMSSSAS